MSQEMHTPYHFVPLSKWVYMPEWAHLVSHDHPFQQGFSGVIDLTLVNHSPLCVGSGKDEFHCAFATNHMGKPLFRGHH